VANSPTIDRRRYRRVQAPILVRPAGLLAWAAARTVNDISLGGIRTYADEPIPVGRRVELELLFADGRTATVLAEVAWAEALGEGAPARQEMGLRLISATPEALEQIERALAGG
jgi:PilZ domain